MASNPTYTREQVATVRKHGIDAVEITNAIYYEIHESEWHYELEGLDALDEELASLKHAVSAAAEALENVKTELKAKRRERADLAFRFRCCERFLKRCAGWRVSEDQALADRDNLWRQLQAAADWLRSAGDREKVLSWPARVSHLGRLMVI